MASYSYQGLMAGKLLRRIAGGKASDQASSKASGYKDDGLAMMDGQTAPTDLHYQPHTKDPLQCPLNPMQTQPH